jgi:antitoxin VapB
VKVDPTPGALSMAISPPMTCASRWTMEGQARGAAGVSHLPLLIEVCRGICQKISCSKDTFKKGRNQAVRIPREFELPGEEAIIRKDGQRLIIEPAPPKSLLAVLATLPMLDEEFPPIRDLPPEPVDL